MVKKRIAIILARGGSKRLPKKNILDFGGKPLLAWTVIAAIDSGLFEHVVVSTDDEEIAEIGRHFGAQVPFLRKVAADDIAPTSEATFAALLQAEEYWGARFEIVAQLMANCPLRSANDIRIAMDSFEKNSTPSQISSFRFGWMNPWWAVKLKSNGEPEQLFPLEMKMRSQDLPSLYCPTGALWIANRDRFIESRDFYMAGHRFEPMSWISAVDIDDKEDLEMARMCLALRKVNV